MRDSRQPVPPSVSAEPPAQPYQLVIERPSRAQRLHDWLDEHMLAITATCATLIGITLTTLLVVSGSMSLVDSTIGQIVLYTCAGAMLVSILLILIAFACSVEATLGRAVLTVAQYGAVFITVVVAIDFALGHL